MIKSCKFLLLLLPLLLYAKQPELTPHDTCVKIHEILKAHAIYHSLNQELISRTLNNFLQELDPNYCYLIEPEVVKWSYPSQQVLQAVLQEIKNEQFTTFRDIYETMVKSIERRQLLDEQLSTNCSTGCSPDDVHPEEFKNMSWAKTEEELKDRLHRIRALQMQTARRLLNIQDNPQEESLFQKRLEKRKTAREEELKITDPAKRKHSLLTHVLKAVASALDSQTAYFTSSEAQQLMLQVQQRLFGVGAQLRDDLNGFTIVRILDNSPLSSHPEVEVGDRIVAVNHEPVIGLDITEAVELIRGPEKTSVTLTFLRQKEKIQDQTFDVQISRGEIILKESRFQSSYHPFGKGMIGVLQLHSFYQDSEHGSASDLSNEIEKMKNEHKLEGVILDLRGNTGGLLPQAVSVAGLFMNKGVVVSIKDNTGFIQRLRKLDSHIAWDGPLIILTDKLSASASEIVAQTLQEYGRAVVVGDPETFGKGTFQTFTLEASSASSGPVNIQGEYKVTRGLYYTVSGKTPQAHKEQKIAGVKTQIEVPGPFSQMEIGEIFSKYPLEPDTIAPCFDDDLADIPLLHRSQIAKMYKTDMQPIATTYHPFLPQLMKNSTLRLQNDLDHQNLITYISNKKSTPPSSLGASDLQLQEAVHIMKDLIFMLKNSDR